MNKPFVLFLLMLIPGMAFADCFCSSSTKAPYCTTGGSAINYTSSQGTNFSVTLGSYGGSSTYTCGQYADKTVWVVGNDNSGSKGVIVSSVSPAPGTERDGWMTNPNWNTNHLDGRGATNNYSAPPSLPQTFTTASGPVSFVKAVSRAQVGASGNQTCDDRLSRACLKYVDILTFVDTIPDTDGDGSTADEFRPSFYTAADKKPGPYTIDAMKNQLINWPSLDPTGIASATIPVSQVEKYFRHPVIEFQERNFSDFGNPYDNVCLGSDCYGYQGYVAVKSLTAMLRLMFNDVDVLQETPRSVGRQAIINLVQIAIDQYGAFLTGKRWSTHGSLAVGGWGGHWHGHKSTPLVAAYLLDDPAMKDMVRGRNFYENQFTYRSSVDNRVYFGLNDDPKPCDGNYSDNCASSNLAVHTWCAPKNGAGPWDSFCCLGEKGEYPFQYLNASVGEYLIVNILGAQSLWNDDLYLIWAKSALDGGRGPGHAEGLYCGPSNKKNNTNRDKSSYFGCDMCKQMWPVYKNYTIPSPATEVFFAATPTSGTLPLAVSFVNASAAGYTTWLWDFGDGNTSTEHSPTHTYTTLGTYTVKLTGSGTAGSKSYTRTDYVVVKKLTVSTTIEAEIMSLGGGYVIDTGTKLFGTGIKVDRNISSTGTASSTFTGSSGSYTVTLFAIPEHDGQPSVTVYVGGIKIMQETFPIDASYEPLTYREEYSVSNVSIKNGDEIKIEGTLDGSANARVDNIVFTAEATIVPITNVSEAMERRMQIPNPFQDAVRIPVTINKGILSIYDNAGNMVRTFTPYSGIKRWDGTDSEGSKLASGIYVYSIKSNDREVSGKIVIIK